MAAPGSECAGSDGGYRDLRDVRVELDPGTARGGGGGGFAVCFWLYLSSSVRPSSVILHQVTTGDDNKLPFLALGEGNKLLLFPLMRLHKEAPATASSYPWTDTTYLSSTSECPLEKWFHIGCEVTENVIRLHVNGDLTAEIYLCSLSDEPDHQEYANKISLVGNDSKLEGYMYNIEVSSVLGTIQEQYAKVIQRSASMDSAGPPLAATSGSMLSRRSSRQISRGSISLSREMGDSILKSMRHSLQLADQLLGDVDSSVLAQLIESGRVLAPEGDVDEDTANTSEHHKVGPLPDDAEVQNNSKSVAAPAPISLVKTKVAISDIPADSCTKVEPYKLSLRLDYAAYMIHLAVFGFLGVFTRYGLQKLFGPDCLALTSDQSPLYPDLPSNMLGSFLMGWFGIIFKADIRNISDHLIVGITTGYMGSLTTFSGWNQKIVGLSSKGHWVYAIAGIVLGMFIVNESITVGVETGERLRSLILKYIRERSSIGHKYDWEHWRVDTKTKQSVLQSVMMIMMSFLWVLSIVLAVVKVRSLADGAGLWMGCSVAPLGVWLRWYLARLNGQGIGKHQSFKWLPIGTLAANVLAAGIMAALAVTSKVVHTKRSTTILSGIQLGFLGCLSTVSTFAAEVYTMRRSGQIARAFVYAASTFLLSFVLGTLIYSVPVWEKHYG